jgi:hypothetical protein
MWAGWITEEWRRFSEVLCQLFRGRSVMQDAEDDGEVLLGGDRVVSIKEILKTK